MALVIALHRSFENADLASQIFARASVMPVIDVEDGCLLKPNHVYITPPGSERTVNRNQFSLRPPRKPRGWPITISVFLLSLAEACGQRAVAVILSGLDHDSSDALQAVKAAGGMTFAQSNPKFSDMPRNAVETGHVDFVLPPAAIARALLELHK